MNQLEQLKSELTEKEKELENWRRSLTSYKRCSECNDFLPQTEINNCIDVMLALEQGISACEEIEKKFDDMFMGRDLTTLNSIIQKKIKQALSQRNKEILRLLRIKCNVRMRGLECDIRTQKNKDYFIGALNEYDVLFRHLEKIDWIIADIKCGSKYLDEKEKKEFINLKEQLTEGEGKKL